MKVLWLTPQSIHTEPITPTLPGEVYNYLDTKVDPLTKLADMVRVTYLYEPDLIIFMGVAEGPYFVLNWVFDEIKQNHPNTPIIHFCCDASCPGWVSGLRYYNEKKTFALTVNIDGNDEWDKGSNDLTLWCPLDPTPYKEVPKDIKLSWAGGLGPERQQMVNGIGDLITVMPRNEKYGSYHEYANFLSRSQATLNLAKSGAGSLQTKNRVREAGYAKCLLLEQRGAPTSNWFTLGEDYLEYGSAQEARSIIESLFSLTQGDDFIKRTAQRLHDKTMKLYHPQFFWDKVLATLNGTTYHLPTL